MRSSAELSLSLPPDIIHRHKHACALSRGFEWILTYLDVECSRRRVCIDKLAIISTNTQRDVVSDILAGCSNRSVCHRDRAGYYQTTVSLPWLLLNSRLRSLLSWAYDVDRSSISVVNLFRRSIAHSFIHSFIFVWNKLTTATIQ